MPETRGVGLGLPMDELFGFESKLDSNDEADEMPIETTALLGSDPERRSSRNKSITEQVLENEHNRRKMSLI